MLRSPQLKYDFDATVCQSDALVVAHGTLPKSEILSYCIDSSKTVIACDGAATDLITLNLRPDIIIGDLDSIHSETLRNVSDSTEIIRIEDQETNDFEKALIHLTEKHYRRLIVTGITGLRVDHTLKNLSVLLKMAVNFDQILIVDDYGISTLAPKSLHLNLPIGTTVSLMSIGGSVKNLNSTGLAWELNHYNLEPGLRDGTSNHTIAESVNIHYDEGNVLIFVGYNLPLKTV